MTKLSPASRAVLTAVTLTRYDVPPEGLPAFAEEMAPLLAAALRAAADQMRYSDQLGLTGFGGYVQAQDQILAIAAELEGAGARALQRLHRP